MSDDKLCEGAAAGMPVGTKEIRCNDNISVKLNARKILIKVQVISWYGNGCLKIKTTHKIIQRETGSQTDT